MKYKVPFIRPSLPAASELVTDYEKIIASNWFTNFGPFERKLRSKAGNFIGEGIHVATVSNATLGIELAIRATIPKGLDAKQILIPSFTFAAGPEVIVSMGFEPVFVDINRSTWQPDLKQATNYLEKHSNEVAGILCCNIFGVGNSEIEQWELLSKKYNLPLIIDSAAGFGSMYDEVSRVGGRGDCEIFSLHATKPFAVGEGGLVASRDEALVKRIMALENFGFDETRNITAIGTNAKLEELSCAIGVRQLVRLNARLRNRRASLRYYKRGLQRMGYIFQPNDELSTVAFVSTLAPTRAHAEAARATLLKKGVEVKNYYTPLHRQAIFSKYKSAGGLRETENIADRIISLPLHDNMDRTVIDYIINIMKHA